MTRMSSSPTALSSVAEKASRAAAILLGLPIRETALKDAEEVQRVPPEAFKAFSEAEQLVNQPNNLGLEAAVLRYQQALEIDPYFALAYAKLAMAYTRQFHLDKDPANLALAQSNATLSLFATIPLRLTSSQAMVFLYSGKDKEALDYFEKSLKVDPRNPETLLYRAEALRDASKWQEAEGVYQEIIEERPNYWPAYNGLGYVLYRYREYEKAAQAYERAANAAPQVALPLANLGTMYEELSERDKAIDACHRSLNRSPNDIAYRVLGDIAFSDGNYKGSLDNYQRAAAVDPKDPTTWRDIGDCYAMLGQPSQVRKSYGEAAQVALRKSGDQPSERYRLGNACLLPCEGR